MAYAVPVATVSAYVLPCFGGFKPVVRVVRGQEITSEFCGEYVPDRGTAKALALRYRDRIEAGVRATEARRAYAALKWMRITCYAGEGLAAIALALSALIYFTA